MVSCRGLLSRLGPAIQSRPQNSSPDEVRLFFPSRGMMGHVEPYLNHVARRDLILHYGATEHRFSISRKAHEDICVLLGSLGREAQFFERFFAHAFEIKIRLHAVYEAKAQCFSGGKQSQANTRPLAK